MRLQGKQHTTTRNGFSARNLPRSLPTDPHSPHACFTPGVYTFSVTWIVLRLLSSLALGYNNRPDQKSPGFVAATGFLPGVLSFLYALSHLERISHRPTRHTQSSTAWSQQPMGKIDTGFPKPVQQSQDDLIVLVLETRDNNPRRKLPRLPGFERVKSELAFQTDTIFSTLRTEGVHVFFLQNKHRLYGFQR